MQSTQITAGQQVKVRIGSALRPAIVREVAAGRVGVTFTDVTDAQVLAVPAGHRGNLLSATVRPNAVQAG
jgi:sRNA-binding protein